MLIKYLYDFAQSRKILDDLAFAHKPIRWIIPLDSDGRMASAGLVETEGERKRGKEFPAPRTSLDKGKGGIAEFLADGITAVFGLESDPPKRDALPEQRRQKRDANNAAKYDHFWSQIQDAYEQTHHAPLRAILAFRGSIRNGVPFLRYGPKEGADAPNEKAHWWVRTAAGQEERLGNGDQFTFQVDGQLPLLDEGVVRPHWRARYAEELAEKDSESPEGLCMVTGDHNVPIAATHLPKIAGVPGTQSFGASIVSFDKEAFTSYGFDQSLNAPVSTQAVAAYTNALNRLIERDDHSYRIGQTILCFWARESEVASSIIANLLKQPQPDAVAKFLKAPWAGVDRQIVQQDRFFSVTLAGNAGRVVVRHWMQTTVRAAGENLAQWFRDLHIVALAAHEERSKRSKSRASPAQDKEQMPPLALFRLACATVRDAKELQTETLAQLYRAALEGSTPSVALIKPILHRLRADLQKYGIKTLLNLSRFALLRLLLNRNRKECDPMIEPKVFDTDDVAYNCGRLLAVLAETQAKAHGYRLEGAGVAERYFGTGSVSPASVFPLLLRLNRHHLDKIRKSDRFASHAHFIENEMKDILSKFQPEGEGLPPQFPRHLDLQAQGRFAIGFYQQKAHTDAQRADAANSQTAATTADN